MATTTAGRGWSLFRNLTGKLISPSKPPAAAPPQFLHTCSSLQNSWERRNRQMFAPQLPGEPPRAAEVHHSRRNIKYSKDKMWYLAKLVRGMSIDQAIAQMEFNDKKGAKVIKEVLLEAQEMAVRNHNVEYKSNLYIAESFSSKGTYLKRIRYHGRGMFGIMDKVRCHYFVKLVEGPAPSAVTRSNLQGASDYVQGLRNRTIIHSL